MDISVVVPLYNEEESLPELFAWIERVMNANGFSYEVIFVNDGSTDRSWQVIEQLQAQAPDKVRGIKFRRNYGKSPALFCGFEQAQGDVVITMDADLQDSPDEIPELYRMITQEGYDLVSGWKQKRYDPLSKTLPTKLFNATARKVSGIKNLHDFNCGLKAYRKERRLQENRRESGAPPGTQIRKDQVRAEPICKRVSGLAFPLVPFPVRHQAHALFRIAGFIDVHLRLHSRGHSRCQQVVLHAPWHALPSCNGLSLLLPLVDLHDYRHTTIRGRIPRRADFT